MHVMRFKHRKTNTEKKKKIKTIRGGANASTKTSLLVRYFVAAHEKGHKPGKSSLPPLSGRVCRVPAEKWAVLSRLSTLSTLERGRGAVRNQGPRRDCAGRAVVAFLEGMQPPGFSQRRFLQ
ncbi:unnamed protein product, partial [Ixodes pacificus]